ncbi:MAG: SDR family oxidoreductase [Candidatus Helarchaeota archaeon]
MLADKIILLTGASSGIGTVILKRFLPEVKFLITSNRKDLSEFSPFQGIPPNLKHIKGDLTIEEDVRQLFQAIQEEFGQLDILINCVGGSLYSHLIENFPVEEFDRIVAINLKSAFLLTKFAIQLMKAHGGNIIHFVSSSAKNIAPKKAPYGCAKAGLAHFIHYAAFEAAPYNIKINGISPTYVFTPRHEKEIRTKMQLTGKSRETIVTEIISSQLLKKQLDSEDLIPLTELLATTDVITGQIYNCTMGEVLFY